MKKTAVLLIFSAAIPAVNAQTVSSTPKQLFRNGEFKYLQFPEIAHIVITRKGGKQTEYDPLTGQATVSKVKWVAADEYWLTIVKTPENHPCSRKGTVLKVKITEYSDTSYKFVAGVSGAGCKTVEGYMGFR